MHILVDGIHLDGEMKGVGLYVTNSLIQLSITNPSVKLSVVVLDKADSAFFPKRQNIQYVHVRFKNHLWHGLRTLPSLLRQLKPDILWIPYETSVAFLNRPFAILCHDIPKEIQSAQLYRCKRSITKYFIDKIDSLLLRRTFYKAQIVFANSNYVANWLIQDEKVNPSCVRIAPCAPGADFYKISQKINREVVWKKLRMPHGYILIFYTGDPRENIEIAPETYNTIVKAGIPCGLVIAGVRKKDKPYLNQLFSGYPWSDQVRFVPFLGVSKVAELAEIYTAALVYLEPSLHEGFGMQVVEAMSCGVPVVSSNRGALPEVVSDAALLVDPLNVSKISEALIAVLSDNYLKDKLVRRGYKRASYFNWNKTAKIICTGLMDASGFK